MKVIVCTAITFGLAASLGGCATVTRGTTTEFSVTSTPPGAAVKTSTGFSCAATPCSMKMPRKDDFDVTATRDGYASQTLHVRSVVAGGGEAGMAGNLVLGGVVGMVVDGTNGSMDDLSPNPMNFTLAAEAAPVPTSDAAPAQVPVQSQTAPPAAAAADPTPAKP